MYYNVDSIYMLPILLSVTLFVCTSCRLQSRLTALLEEERRARREESALGEAVLREVRETQGLLGEVRST